MTTKTTRGYGGGYLARHDPELLAQKLGIRDEEVDPRRNDFDQLVRERKQEAINRKWDYED